MEYQPFFQDLSSGFNHGVFRATKLQFQTELNIHNIEVDHIKSCKWVLLNI